MNATLRDHLANERTFLAWLRTGLAFTAFGLVVERLTLFLHYLGESVSAQQSTRIATLGIMFMWLGTALGPLGLWRFLVERRNIGAPMNGSSLGAVATVAVFTTVMMCLLTIIIVW